MRAAWAGMSTVETARRRSRSPLMACCRLEARTVGARRRAWAVSSATMALETLPARRSCWLASVSRRSTSLASSSSLALSLKFCQACCSAWYWLWVSRTVSSSSPRRPAWACARASASRVSRRACARSEDRCRCAGRLRARRSCELRALLPQRVAEPAASAMAMARAVSMGPLPRLAGRTAEAVEPAGAEQPEPTRARRRPGRPPGRPDR